MRRRIVRTLRVGLLVTGAAALVWYPFSVCFLAYVAWPNRFGGVMLDVGCGAVGFYLSIGSGVVYDPPHLSWTFERFTYDSRDLLRHLVPSFDYESRSQLRAWDVNIPLWLLAALCLAWPVTSFLLHRRRQRRGFEVRAGDGSTVSTADS